MIIVNIHVKFGFRGKFSNVKFLLAHSKIQTLLEGATMPTAHITSAKKIIYSFVDSSSIIFI